MKKQILLVDDHPSTLRGIKVILEDEGDLEVVATARNAQEATACAIEHSPDIAVVDHHLGAESPTGITVIEDLRRLDEDMIIIMMTVQNRPQVMGRAVESGANGYIVKDASAHQVIDAIRQNLRGVKTPYISPSMTGAALSMSQSENGDPIEGALTNREMEVFRLIGQGLSTKEVSEKLSIAPSTVGVHKSHIREKLDCDSQHKVRVQAIRYQEGIQ